MFLTHEMAKNEPMSAMYGPGLSVWHQIKLAGTEPFFLVEYTTEEDGEQRTSTMLFSYINQVCQFTEMSDTEILRLRVMLVSPAWLNKTERCVWQMDELAEVWEGVTYPMGEAVRPLISRYVFKSGEVIDRQPNDSSDRIEWAQIWKSKSGSAAVGTSMRK